MCKADLDPLPQPEDFGELSEDTRAILLNMTDQSETTRGSVSQNMDQNLQLALTFSDDSSSDSTSRNFYMALQQYPYSNEAFGFTAAVKVNETKHECSVTFDMERRNITYWNVVCYRIPGDSDILPQFYLMTNPIFDGYFDYSLCLVALIK